MERSPRAHSMILSATRLGRLTQMEPPDQPIASHPPSSRMPTKICQPRMLAEESAVAADPRLCARRVSILLTEDVLGRLTGHVGVDDLLVLHRGRILLTNV